MNQPGELERSDSCTVAFRQSVQNSGGTLKKRFAEEKKTPKVRINDQIRADKVRVISPEGEQLGVLSLEEALSEAQKLNLDLVEIAAKADPPVVKIQDFGKYKYDQAKRERQNRKKQHTIQVKGIRLTPNINDHDLEVKARKAREFLEDGARLKVSVLFRGRMIARKDLGRETLEKFIGFLVDIAEVETAPAMEGARNMVTQMVPKKSQKR